MAKQSMDQIGALLQGLFEQQNALGVLLETVVNGAMEAEVSEHLQAQPHERRSDRRGHRNGYKPRTLKTRAGNLALQVPQVRGCEPYHPSMFARWQRSERALLVACAEMYYQGTSTRKVAAVLEQMCGFELSASTVSRVAGEIDEKLAQFRARRLDETTYPYLQIDARYEKVRVEDRVISQAVLVIVGFTAQGHREVLSWCVGDSESEQTWGELFRSLKDRGLRGVELVISDAHGGIRAAMARHFQGVSWQRCRVHFKREMWRKVGYKQMKPMLAELASVFKGEDRAECLRRGEEMACQWEGRYPEVARMLRDGLGDCLTALSFPEHHRRRLTSTNLLENIMRQLKRRTAVVGVFPNRASCDRLVGAQLLELHEQWQTEEKAYFNMEQKPAV